MLSNGFLIKSPVLAEWQDASIGSPAMWKLPGTCILVHPSGRVMHQCFDVAFEHKSLVSVLQFRSTEQIEPVPDTSNYPVIMAKWVDTHRDGGTAVYEDLNQNEYYVWRPTGAVYKDIGHSEHLKVVIKPAELESVEFRWNGKHSPYHATGTGFEPGSPNDDAAKLTAHG